MAINRVDFGGNTLIDLTGDSLESAEQLLKGIIAHAKDGSVITGLLEAGGGGMKIEVFSITPADQMSAGTYEIGETTITNPHFCLCFDGTHPDSADTDTEKYCGLMTYVGCDATLWGDIGSKYNKSTLGLMYNKYSSQYTYRRHDYGKSLTFNSQFNNGFYVKNGKLYCESGYFSSKKWHYEAGHTYYILLIGE